MKIKVIICFLFPLCCSCKQKEIKKAINHPEQSHVRTYNFKEFESAFLSPISEKIRVINFWATWCRPCVKELPYFEEVTKNQKDVEVILVSLDLSNQKDSKLLPFLEAHNLKSKVVHLDEPDANAWIPKVSKDWSGAIPATVIINKNNKKFYEQSFNYKQLMEAINTFKNEN